MGWQPIETAPKDGTFFLAVGEQGGAQWPVGADCRFAVIHWCPLRYANGWYYDGDEYTFEPTHWMPLPPPPEE